MVTMFVHESELNEHYLQRTFQGCFLPSFDSFGKAASEEKIFQKSTNQKQELPVVAMFVNESGRNQQSLQRTCHRCCLPSFGSFGQAVSEEKIFKNRPIRNKNCLWWPCLLMDRDKMRNLQRGPSIDASYHVSLHLADGFQRRRLKYEKLTDDRRRLTLPLARFAKKVVSWNKIVYIFDRQCIFVVTINRIIFIIFIFIVLHNNNIKQPLTTMVIYITQ